MIISLELILLGLFLTAQLMIKGLYLFACWLFAVIPLVIRAFS